MILWLTGNSGAGKTTLARKLSSIIPGSIVVDGDEFRAKTKNRDLSKEGRIKNCLAVGAYAKAQEDGASCVIVSVIAPYRELREKLASDYGVEFVYLLDRGHIANDKYPYELPTNAVCGISSTVEHRSPKADTGGQHLDPVLSPGGCS